MTDWELNRSQMPSFYDLDIDVYYLQGLLNSFNSIQSEAQKWAKSEWDKAAEAAQKDDDFAEYLGGVVADAEILQGMAHAALSTIAASAVENRLKAILKAAGETPPNNADWRCLSCIFSRKAGKNLGNLPGYNDVDLLRRLSNAFKHSDGTADTKLAKQLGKDRIDQYGKILYDKLDWTRFFTSSQKFISSVVAELK